MAGLSNTRTDPLRGGIPDYSRRLLGYQRANAWQETEVRIIRDISSSNERCARGSVLVPREKVGNGRTKPTEEKLIGALELRKVYPRSFEQTPRKVPRLGKCSTNHMPMPASEMV